MRLGPKFVILFLILSVASALRGVDPQLEGKVTEVLAGDRSLRIEIAESSDGRFPAGETLAFKVGEGDIAIGYLGRTVSGEVVKYGKGWMLQTIWPMDAPGAKMMADTNRTLHKVTASLPRRKWCREGDYVPDFALFNQKGEIVTPRQLRGENFVMNFIFTRCQAQEMCPASSMRMSKMQDEARQLGMDELRFVTISFDPAYDTPGILNQYAKGYGMEPENFDLLTGPEETVDDLLRQFGILTRNEDGTIDHTMATLLVDKSGKIAYRREGSRWTVDEFIEEAGKL